MASFPREDNRIPVIGGVSSVDFLTPVTIAVNPNTHNLIAESDAQTSGGWTPYKLLSANSTNGTNIKGTAGQIGGWALYNTNAAARYVKLYNKATTPSVGTDTPVLTVLVPGNANGSGSNLAVNLGATFSLGIGFGITTGMADNDTGAVGANEVIVNFFWI